MTEEERKALGGRAVEVRGVAFSATEIRFASHLDTTDEMLALAKRKIEFVVREMIEGKKRAP